MLKGSTCVFNELYIELSWFHPLSFILTLDNFATADLPSIDVHFSNCW